VEIRDAEDKPHAKAAMKLFADTFSAKFPKAVAKITDDADQLLAFDDFPAEYWIHLKTSNPNPPSPRCGCAPRPPKALAPAPPG